jgi:cyclopropane-fatty-acyl-phospholipid synthase
MRALRFLPDLLLYGSAYALLNFFIHKPTPLDEEWVWRHITQDPEPRWRRFVREAWPPAFLRKWLLRAKQFQDAALGIEEHYDVSNDFYKLFLDPKFMFYTCADHIRGDETLIEAQTNKANHILRLLDPRPGEKIAELGCGWASMLRHIEQHTGVRDGLVGYTLSKEQAAYIREHYGYDVRLENFVDAEYPKESFDKFYSIGAWEAVRPQENPIILKKIYDALKPGGRFVLHFFSRLHPRLPPAAAVAQLFFPGHVQQSHPEHFHEFEKAGFRVTHISCHDYRKTLRQWFEALVANREQALKLVDVRTYNRYVVFFPASYKYFNDRTGVLFRYVLSKPPISGDVNHLITDLKPATSVTGNGQAAHQPAAAS